MNKFKAIRCFCSVIFLGMMLAGCGSVSQVSVENDVGNTGTSEAAARNELELKAPTDIQAIYSSGEGMLYVTWDSVEYADSYELDYGTNTIYTIESEPSVQIKDLLEGETYTIKVRAKHESGNHVDYSDWTGISYEIPIYLSAPANIRYDLDGTKFYVIWDAEENAEQYEIEYSNNADEMKTALVDIPRGTMRSISEGKQYKFRIRALKTIGDHTYYSDWVESDYTVPQIDYNSDTFSYIPATRLDYNRLLKWAEGKGYSYKVETEDELTIVDVSCEDTLNNGFWSKVGGSIAAGIGGYMGGYGSEVYDSVSSDFSSAQSVFGTIMENEGVKDYLNKINENANQSGKEAALQYGLQALFADRKLHFVYYYKDTECGAICSECLFLKNNRDNYEQENYGSFTKKEDGGYHLRDKNTGQTYRVYVTSIVANTYEYWDVIVYNDRSRQ